MSFINCQCDMVKLYSCLFKENGKVTDVSKITLILLIFYVPKKTTTK